VHEQHRACWKSWVLATEKPAQGPLDPTAHHSVPPTAPIPEHRITRRRVSYIAEPHPNVLNLTSLMTFVSGSTLIWSRITSPHCWQHVISTYAEYLVIAGITYGWRSDQSLAHRLIGFVQCSDVPRARVVCCRGCQLPGSNAFEQGIEEKVGRRTIKDLLVVMAPLWLSDLGRNLTGHRDRDRPQ
jgi:hypothetical protein